MFTLWIAVLVTSLQQPKEHVGLRVHMPYETQFTCQHAQEHIDGDAVSRAIAHARKYQQKHITVRKVVISCEKGSPNI